MMDHWEERLLENTESTTLEVIHGTTMNLLYWYNWEQIYGIELERNENETRFQNCFDEISTSIGK